MGSLTCILLFHWKNILQNFHWCLATSTEQGQINQGASLQRWEDLINFKYSKNVHIFLPLYLISLGENVANYYPYVNAFLQMISMLGYVNWLLLITEFSFFVYTGAIR